MSKSKLSDGEIKIKPKKFLEKAEKITRQISRMSHLLEEDREEFTRFVGYVDDLNDVFDGFNNYDVPAHVVNEHYADISQVVYKSGTHKVLCDVVTSRLNTRNYVTLVKDVTMTTSVYQMWTLVGALLMYCRNVDVKVDLTKDSGFLLALVHTLDAGHRAHLNRKLSETQNSILSRCMKLLGTCAYDEETIQTQHEAGTVNVLLPYLDSHKGSIQLTSLNTLAKLVNEEEAENLLFTHGTIFTLLIQRLDKAWHSSSHYEDWGWSVEGLIRMIRRLARNDANTSVVVEAGCLPLLVNVLDSPYDYEVTESLDTLWVLSLNEDNKEKMVEERHLIERVWEKYIDNSTSEMIKNSSFGILWSLTDQLSQRKKMKYVSIATEIELQKSKADMTPTQQSLQQTQGTSSDAASLHDYVMLSYNWGHQKTILQICQKLREANIPVWIDVDFMAGSTLETMAKAVEDCSIFIMAVSKRYKESPNTRLEAGYAQKLNKPIIPLMMERDYNPDGWLGILMESKLFYDFSGMYPFDNKMSELRKGIRKAMRQDTKKK